MSAESDRELLELAAKAAGINIIRSRLDDAMHSDMLVSNSARNPHHETGPWNPLTDDGDTLRMAVKRNVFFNPLFFQYLALERFAQQDHDDAKAHRRAIVRTVAAES